MHGGSETVIPPGPRRKRTGVRSLHTRTGRGARRGRSALTLLTTPPKGGDRAPSGGCNENPDKRLRGDTLAHTEGKRTRTRHDSARGVTGREQDEERLSRCARVARRSQARLGGVSEWVSLLAPARSTQHAPCAVDRASKACRSGRRSRGSAKLWATRWRRHSSPACRSSSPRSRAHCRSSPSSTGAFLPALL